MISVFWSPFSKLGIRKVFYFLRATFISGWRSFFFNEFNFNILCLFWIWCDNTRILFGIYFVGINEWWPNWCSHLCHWHCITTSLTMTSHSKCWRFNEDRSTFLPWLLWGYISSWRVFGNSTLFKKDFIRWRTEVIRRSLMMIVRWSFWDYSFFLTSRDLLFTVCWSILLIELSSCPLFIIFWFDLGLINEILWYAIWLHSFMSPFSFPLFSLECSNNGVWADNGWRIIFCLETSINICEIHTEICFRRCENIFLYWGTYSRFMTNDFCFIFGKMFKIIWLLRTFLRYLRTYQRSFIDLLSCKI